MLVGRHAELAAVSRFLDEVAAGPAALVVVGEPGIGKSMLWESAIEEAASQGLQVLVARPVVAETALAFAGLTDLLDPVVGDVLPELSEPQRRALSVALLREASGGGRLDRRAVSAAVLSALRCLATTGPLLLAVDDLQWLDRPSAAALEFSLRRLGSLPVGLLACERTEGGTDVRQGLASTFPEGRLTRLELGPLSFAVLHEIVKAALGRSPPRRVLARIEKTAGGNPFFALELARSIPVDSPNVEGLPLPASLQALVDARVAGLPPRVLEALLVAATLRSPSAETVAAVTRRSVATLQPALERAESAGIVEFDSSSVRFVHPLFAAGVYAAASGAQRRRVHRRVAALVAEPEERARHLALGAAGPDAALARVLDHAAESAQARGAPEAAAELLEEARRLTPAGPSPDTQRRAMQAAEYHFHAGELTRARQLLEGVLQEVSGGNLRAQALRLLAELHYHQQGVAQAIPLFEEALEHADADAAALRLTVELHLAFAANLAGDWPGAEPHARRALALAEELRDDACLAEALAVSTILDYLLGRGLDEERLERALELEDTQRQATVEMRPTLIAGHLMLYEGRLERSCELFLGLRERVLERGEEFDLPFLSSYLAWAECMRGDLAAARLYAEEALETASRIGLDSLRCLALAFSALPLAYAGDAEATRENAYQSVALAASTGFTVASIWARWAHAALELSLGNPAAADTALAPLTDLLETTGIAEPIRSPFLADHIEALVSLGEIDRAERLSDMLEEAGRRHGRGWALVQAGRSRALLSAAQGALDSAARTIEETLGVSERIEHRLEHARTLLVAGQIERRRKNRRRARDHLRAAFEIFDEAGAQVWAARTRSELRASGETIPRRGRGAPGALTPQERQVALHVVAGKTNKEVAAALFLSTKTVEFHLSHVYRKLGVRNRTELATQDAWLDSAPDEPRETPEATRSAVV